MFGAFLSTLCAFVQYSLLFPALQIAIKGGRYAAIMREQFGLPFSSFIYHNIFGGYLAVILPIGIYYAVVEKRLIYTILSSVMIVGIILSSTRIGMAITLLTLAISMFLAFKGGRAKEFVLFGTVLIIAITLSFLIFYPKTPKEASVTQVFKYKTKTAYSQLGTMNTRTDIWKNGLKAFYDRPLRGYGAGAFEFGYRQHSDGENQTLFAHNTFLKIAVELGFLGLCAFLFYLAGIFPSLWASRREDRYLFIAMSVAWALLFGCLDFSFDTPAHVITFFVLSSILIERRRGMEGGSGHSALDRTIKFCRTHCSNGKYPVFLSIMVMLLSSFYFTGALNLSKDSVAKGLSFEEQGFFTDAFVLYGDAIKEMPVNDEGYIRAVSILIKSHENDVEPGKRQIVRDGILFYLKKMKNIKARDSELYFTMGRGYAVNGDYRLAEFYFSKSLHYFPSSAYYTYEVARFYLDTGQTDKSRELIEAYRPYMARYRNTYNPKGLFVHKIRDLEADIECKEGKKEDALKIVRENLKDAEAGVYLVSSAKSKEYVSREVLMKYLKERVRFFEAQTYSSLDPCH